MTVLCRHGLVVSLFWKPVRDVLQRWRICLASLVFFTIFLTNNFGLSTGTAGYAQRTTSISPGSLGEQHGPNDPHVPRIRTRKHEYQLSNYLSSKHSRTSNNEESSSDSYIYNDRESLHLEDKTNSNPGSPSERDKYGHKDVQSSTSLSLSDLQHYQRSSDITSSSPTSSSGSLVYNKMDVSVKRGSSYSASSDKSSSSTSSQHLSNKSHVQVGTNIKSPRSSSVLKPESSASMSRDPPVSSAKSPATSESSSATYTWGSEPEPLRGGDIGVEHLNTVKDDVKLKQSSQSQSKKQSNHLNSTTSDSSRIPAGKVAPPASSSGPQPRRRNVAGRTKEPANFATVSSARRTSQCERYAGVMFKNSSRYMASISTQCLDDVSLHICSQPADWDGECRRTQELRRSELNFCKSFQLYHTIPHGDQDGGYGQNCELENMSEDNCKRKLSEVTAKDEEAREMFNNFQSIFSKFDNEDLFSSVPWNYLYCENAYRDWICAQMIPFYNGTRPVEPCGWYCEEVENKCPYFKPHLHEAYAGEPTFICTDQYSREENTPPSEPCHRIEEDAGGFATIYQTDAMRDTWGTSSRTATNDASNPLPPAPPGGQNYQATTFVNTNKTSANDSAVASRSSVAFRRQSCILVVVVSSVVCFIFEYVSVGYLSVWDVRLT